MTGVELRECFHALGLFSKRPSGELTSEEITKAGSLIGVGRSTLYGYLRNDIPIPERVAQQVRCLCILHGILKRRKVSAEDLRRIEAIFQAEPAAGGDHDER